MLLLNLSLAIVWLLLTGQFTVQNFFVGFFVTYGVLGLFGQAIQGNASQAQAPRFFSKGFEVLYFGLFFLWELILANVRVAIDVLRPTPKIEPAVVAVPIDGFSDAEVTLLANFITLTPGTLSLDVIENRSVKSGRNEGNKRSRMLYIHAMHAGVTQNAVERFRRQIQLDLARRVREVLR
ncbi:Na+/H+ antiporter subunit E [Chloroflexi bacterium TSY]|nr:Na+/H+ antiporter subunit E [Chloroflexi bacterium TSY]